MSKYVSAITLGPPSIGFPLPLKILPNMSSLTGVLSTSPVNSNFVFLPSIPLVPSKICTTARSPSTSSTCPRLAVPSPSRTLTISAYFALETLSKITSGPATARTVLYVNGGSTASIVALAAATCTLANSSASVGAMASTSDAPRVPFPRCIIFRVPSRARAGERGRRLELSLIHI